MNDEELELDLFGNQENEEGDTTLDADISSIMESIDRSIRDTRYVFNRHRPMTMTLDLERVVGYARPIESIPVRMTLDENRIVPMMENAPPSITRVNARGIRANNVYYDTEATVTRSNEIAEMIRNTRVYPTTKTQVSDDYSKDNHKPKEYYRYINAEGRIDVIETSKDFDDVFNGSTAEYSIDQYKEIVEDAINVISVLSSVNHRLSMHKDMLSQSLNASKESVKDLNSQLTTIKAQFDKLMGFVRK